MRLFLVYSEFLKLYENVDDDDFCRLFFEDLDVQFRNVLNDISLKIFKVLNIDKDFEGVVGSFDNFNYSFIGNGFALLEYNNSDFKVRVHMDDVDRLDELLNDLEVKCINLQRANHNLNRRVLYFNKLLDRMISENDDKYILNILESLKNGVF